MTSYEFLSERLHLIEKMESISTKLPSKNDQDVRDIIRLIMDKGGDYTNTSYGDMTTPLLNSMSRVLEVIDAYREALLSALPHIECKTKEQDNLITHIGEITHNG